MSEFSSSFGTSLPCGAITAEKHTVDITSESLLMEAFAAIGAAEPSTPAKSEVGDVGDRAEEPLANKPKVTSDVVSQRNTASSDMQRELAKMSTSMHGLITDVVDTLLSRDEDVDVDFMATLSQKFLLTLTFLGKVADVDLKGKDRSNWKTPKDMDMVECAKKLISNSSAPDQRGNWRLRL